MCGIAGGYGSLPDGVLEKMARKIAHRGPDNIAWESHGDVHLAHTRLSIIDLSPNSNQPLWDVKQQACIVFNGEIYNYKVLRQKLIKQGVAFHSEGDAEVLLNLYLCYKEDFLSQVEGIFSLCIWDKNRQEMFLARDHFGVKPLYYAQTQEGFFFSSEIKSLTAIPTLNKSLCHDALFRSLVFLYSPGEDTLLKQVKKLRPGHFIRLKDSQIVEYTEYWDWPEYQPVQRSSEENAQRVLSSIEKAVEQQLVADVPVGAFLSGGLDSSLLVALASKTTPISCFTIDSSNNTGENDGFEDDLPYAKKVAEHLGVELDILKASPNIVSQLPDMIYSLDEMQADPAPLNVMLICEQARKKGVKVLLSGAGGDDVFSGYRRHVAIQLERYWSWMPSFARKGLRTITQALPKSDHRLRRLSKAFSYAHLDEDERLLSYFYWIDPNIVRDLFNDDIRSSLSENPMTGITNRLKALPSKDPLERMLFLERHYFLVDHNFNYTDKMSMASGVEVRVPFLDKHVSQTASEIESGQKQHGKAGKWILKKAAEACLPKSIIYRPKSGFGAPLRHWLKTDLAPMVNDLLSAENINKRGIFNSEKIENLITADRKGQQDYSYPIFALLCFEIWCQKFID